MMKKLILLIALFVGMSVAAIAQQYRDVVELKNGTIIKGQIIEQIPNETIKIETGDGSLFVYQMNEITRITKEEVSQRLRRNNAVAPANMIDGEPYYVYRKRMRNTLRGYKGFIDAGYVSDGNDYDAGHWEFTTSHGYQINNFFFVGGGLGLQYYGDFETISVPIFANFRSNFINKKVTPYGDLKLGYTAGSDIYGVYLAMAIGCRFATKNKNAFNVSLGFEIQENVQDYWYDYDRWGGYYDYYYDSDAYVGVTLRFGFEF